MGRSRKKEDNEESFFVSMTDIMVGLLFIFILIIMYFAIQAKIDAVKLREADEKNKTLVSENVGLNEQIIIILGKNEDLEKKNEALRVIFSENKKQKDVVDRLLSKILSLQGVVTDYKDKAGKYDVYVYLKNYQKSVLDHRAKLLGWIRDYLEEQGVVGSEIIADQGVLRLPEGILFDSGQYRFAEGSKAERTAKALAEALSTVLPCSVLNEHGKPLWPASTCSGEGYRYSNKDFGFVQSIFIEGHTDNNPIRDGLPGDINLKTNLKLAARRSTNTIETIVSERPNILDFYGPILDEKSTRFEKIIGSSAYGEWRPVGDNRIKEGRQTNRRIDLRILMYVPPNIQTMQRLSDAVGASVNSQLASAGSFFDLRTPEDYQGGKPKIFSYKAYVGGFMASQFSVNFDISKGGYRVQLKADPSDFMEGFPHLLQGEMLAFASGQFSPLPPNSFSSQAYENKNVVDEVERKVKLEFKNKRASILDILPDPIADEGREVISGEGSFDASDPISGVLNVGQRIQKSNSCEAKLKIFDGRRLNELHAEDKGTEVLSKSNWLKFAGETRRCDFTFKQIAGYIEKDGDQLPTFKVNFKKIYNSGPWVPVRVLFEYNSMSFRIFLSDYGETEADVWIGKR